MKNLIYKIKKKLSISKKGFTLIEMLVVVLIIGILAGIALPQYTKTVEKTRLAEAFLTLSALQRAVDVYVLTNGYSDVYFLNDDPDAVLDIDINQNCDEQGCLGNNFCYFAYCASDECAVSAERLAPGNNACSANGIYDIQIVKRKDSENWEEKICHYSSEYEWLCKYLESQGFEREETC